MTDLAEVTPWFPRSIRPIHIGAYEVKNQFGYKCRRWWDGYSWKTFRGGLITDFCIVEWRGLANEPPKQKKPLSWWKRIFNMISDWS